MNDIFALSTNLMIHNESDHRSFNNFNLFYRAYIPFIILLL